MARDILCYLHSPPVMDRIKSSCWVQSCHRFRFLLKQFCDHSQVRTGTGGPPTNGNRNLRREENFWYQLGVSQLTPPIPTCSSNSSPQQLLHFSISAVQPAQLPKYQMLVLPEQRQVLEEEKKKHTQLRFSCTKHL